MSRIIDLRKRSEETPPVREAASVLPVQEPARSQPAVHIPESTTQALLAWQALPTGARTERKYRIVSWGLLFVLISGAFVLQRNMLVPILALLGLTALLLQGKRGRQEVQIAVDEAGLTVGDRSYSFASMKSFWVDATPGGVRELSIEFKNRLLPYLRVPLGKQDPVPLRIHLSVYLPEQEHEPSLVDAGARFL